MKNIQNILVLAILTLIVYACGSSPIKNEVNKEKPVVIANDSLEYEIIIIDIGFNQYLNGVALPRGYYSQKYMESRNFAWVITWNQRAQNPTRHNPNIYENIINYEAQIDYGYEVNYLLFNYFLFAQQKYNMNLGGGFRPNRIR